MKISVRAYGTHPNPSVTFRISFMLEPLGEMYEEYLEKQEKIIMRNSLFALLAERYSVFVRRMESCYSMKGNNSGTVIYQ